MLSRAENDRRNLVGCVIEQAIIKAGGNKMLYDILCFLYTNYSCYAADCLDNPQYLVNALKEHDVKYSRIVVSSITSELEEFSYHKPIKDFVVRLDKFRDC
ncbi:MAG: hypothetical protein ACREAE_08530 [Nitrosopumilaceae archaeon]